MVARRSLVVLGAVLGACTGNGSPAGGSTGAATAETGLDTTGTATEPGTATGPGTAGTSTTASGTTGNACPPDQTSCEGVCVDTQTDPAHCGGCDNPCGDFESCQGGTCSPDTTIAEVVLGDKHTCIRTFTGRVRCWGANGQGQLGLGHNEDIGDDELPSSASDVDLGGIPALRLAAGALHTCALLDGGTVRCWGANSNRQLGFEGSGNNAPDPNLNVQNVSSAVAIAASAGGIHTCALIEGGTVRCWGWNTDGQLGYGISSSGTVAMGDVDVGGTVTAIAAGRRHTCALLDDGDIRCWGANDVGQLGHGDNTFDRVGDDEVPAGTPTVALGEPAVAIAAGSEHTCALLESGTRVRCWGNSPDGELGYGDIQPVGDDEPPADAGDVLLSPTPGAESIVRLAVGSKHTCVTFEDGAAQCWGQAAYGQLGYGSLDDIGDDEPPAGAGLLMAPSAATLATGGHHTCMLATAGSVRCWGFAPYGSLGYGDAVGGIYGDMAGEVPDALPDVEVFP